jgi:hypothetical protein
MPDVIIFTYSNDSPKIQKVEFPGLSTICGFQFGSSHEAPQ